MPCFHSKLSARRGRSSRALARFGAVLFAMLTLIVLEGCKRNLGGTCSEEGGLFSFSCHSENCDTSQTSPVCIGGGLAAGDLCGHDEQCAPTVCDTDPVDDCYFLLPAYATCAYPSNVCVVGTKEIGDLLPP